MTTPGLPAHSSAYRYRRALNWFPLGLTYALLYMGRYNLTVAKTSLGDLMTKEDFGVIFGAGTITYAISFLLNGPMVDRMGGRKGMLIAAMGSAFCNLAMGAYLLSILSAGTAADAPLRLIFSALYAANMYFQSFAAVSIVKVNAHWFHVSERGGFSGIFGTMIASGIFLAFTVNEWLLGVAKGLWPDSPSQQVVFFAPAALLLVMFVVEWLLLADSPGKARLSTAVVGASALAAEPGHQPGAAMIHFRDFDTGDASSGDTSDTPVPTGELMKRILTNPIILTVAFIELCTGVVRNGVMHWFPIYAKEVWVLDSTHLLRNGSWENWQLVGGMFAVAAVTGAMAYFSRGARRGWLASLAAIAFLAPFLQGGWGGILFVSGVIGGNVAGWVSDLLFQSRRGPAAAGLYGLLTVCLGVMIFVLAPATNEVLTAKPESGLLPGDRIVSIAGKDTARWDDVQKAVGCWPAVCKASQWDAEACVCSTKAVADPNIRPSEGTLPAVVERNGSQTQTALPDPMATQRAGDKRSLKAQPRLPMSPWFMGVIVFLVSLGVIGTHGLLSGTATMDFGGKKGAATAVGVIDGFVYLGTAIQSVSLGYLTSRDWFWWPIFLLPFGAIGLLLCTRIWNARPRGRGAH